MIIATNRDLRSRRNAFTLLEVLVVVAILVVLASVASIYLFRYLEDAKADATKLKMQQLERACKAYATKNDGVFPASLQELIAPADGSDPYLEGGITAILDGWQQPINYNPQAIGPVGEIGVSFSASYGKRFVYWPNWAQGQ